MSNAVLLYATAPDAQIARSIAAALIEERRAACVNILGEITSVYRWEGAIESASEWAFLVKTTSDAAPGACEAIVARHPHAVPAVIGVDAAAAFTNSAFLSWLQRETA